MPARPFQSVVWGSRVSFIFRVDIPPSFVWRVLLCPSRVPFSGNPGPIHMAGATHALPVCAWDHDALWSLSWGSSAAGRVHEKHRLALQVHTVQVSY